MAHRPEFDNPRLKLQEFLGLPGHPKEKFPGVRSLGGSREYEVPPHSLSGGGWKAKKLGTDLVPPENQIAPKDSP